MRSRGPKGVGARGHRGICPGVHSSSAPPACQHTLPPAAAEAARLPAHPATGSSRGCPPANTPCHRQQRRPPTCQRLAFARALSPPAAEATHLPAHPCCSHHQQQGPPTCQHLLHRGARSGRVLHAAVAQDLQGRSAHSRTGVSGQGRSTKQQKTGVGAQQQPGATNGRAGGGRHASRGPAGGDSRQAAPPNRVVRCFKACPPSSGAASAGGSPAPCVLLPPLPC